MTGPGDVLSVHAGLRYGYFFLVLTRFRLLVRIGGIPVDLYPILKTGSSAWVGSGEAGQGRRLKCTESP